MSTLIVSPQAQQDIDNIYDYIARHDHRVSTADKVVTELTQACRAYAEIFASASTLGSARPDLGENHRVFAHKRWVVVFRPIEHGIEVLRVLDGSRDFLRLFAE